MSNSYRPKNKLYQPNLIRIVECDGDKVELISHKLHQRADIFDNVMRFMEDPIVRSQCVSFFSDTSYEPSVTFDLEDLEGRYNHLCDFIQSNDLYEKTRNFQHDYSDDDFE